MKVNIALLGALATTWWCPSLSAAKVKKAAPRNTIIIYVFEPDQPLPRLLDRVSAAELRDKIPNPIYDLVEETTDAKKKELRLTPLDPQKVEFAPR